ncbi:hypothetical protein NW762_003165 [Fusarium torreyae]|uniref:Uncharacterized protein n=1 Tax=Fusarium torreyae TaxID=1237075 RepID=A0A9W8VIT7_9HYPO|nr:hypothetical protein NW762_003165 [Fusarium torreyae]
MSHSSQSWYTRFQKRKRFTHLDVLRPLGHLKDTFSRGARMICREETRETMKENLNRSPLVQQGSRILVFTYQKSNDQDVLLKAVFGLIYADMQDFC